MIMSKAKQIIIDGKVINLTPETDSYFDENSENPVQNKVLHSKFNEIEGNFDDVNSAIEDIVNGATSVAKANSLNTSTKIGVGEAVSSTPQVYTGKKDIVIPVKTLREAYLAWGGKVISGNISTLDCAMKEDTSKNRLSFLDPDAIDIEYSNDGGITWLDYINSYNKSEDEYKKFKTQIVTTGFNSLVLSGGHTKTSSATINDKLRITINATKIINGTTINYFYFQITKILILYQSPSSGKLNIEYLRNSDVNDEDEILEGKNWQVLNQNTGIEVKGNSGWNSIYPYLPSYLFGGGQAGAIRRLRFSFYTINEDNYTKAVRNIFIYGSNIWTYTNGKIPLAKYGHMYNYDIDGNVTFPANITSSNITKITNDISALNTIISENGSDISKIKNKLFPLEVTLSVKTKDGGSTAVQEYTGANKEFIISWTTKIDGESVTPTALTLTVGGTIVTTDASKTSITVAADNDRTINLSVEAEGRSAEVGGSIKFAYSAYTGLVDDGFEISESNITTKLTEMSLVDGRSRTYTYAAHSNKKIIYCYASAYGNLSQIIGPSNLDYIHLFEKTNVNINNIAYNVYIYTKINSTEGNLTYNYK